MLLNCDEKKSLSAGETCCCNEDEPVGSDFFRDKYWIGEMCCCNSFLVFIFGKNKIL